MQLITFSFQPERGWSVREFPQLDSADTLVLVFAAPEFMDDPEPLRQLRRAYPDSKFIGCSTAGEIFGRFVNDATLSVAVVRFERTRLLIGSTEISEATSHAAGAQLARQFSPAGLRALLVLSEGLDINGSELVRGLASILPAHVVVIGGLAGDGERFQGTWVLRNDEPTKNAIVAVGLYGESLRIHHGSRGGWDGFGPERRITRSSGSVLYELDGKPALALYKEYLGQHAAELPGAALHFPLAIRPRTDGAPQLVRCISAVDEVEQSITFAGDVPTGWYAQLMQTSFDRLIEGAGEAAELACGDGQAGPMLALAVSCAGRRVVLGERIDQETDATLDRLPRGAQQIGFYAYGEIAPYSDGTCDLHNQTMTLTTFREE